MTLTPVTDVTLALPRLCGTREQAHALVARQVISPEPTVLISARLQSVGTEDYADGLIGALMAQHPRRITLVGHTREFGRFMRQAATRHGCNVLDLLT